VQQTCFFVIYFAFVGVEHERDRLWHAMTSLAERQTEVLRVLATTIQQQKVLSEVPKEGSARK
jgi:hypothetical protein